MQRPSPDVDHVVTVASRPVKAAVPVQVRLVNPVSQILSYDPFDMLTSHDRWDREVRAAAKEYHSLITKRFTIREIDPPYQKGWRRSYVLRDSMRARPDRDVIEAILKVIGSTVVHHDRTFRKRRGRGRVFHEIEQPLRPIPDDEWNRMNPSVGWQCYFQYQLLMERNHHWRPFWVFMHPAWFCLKIERNWIQQIRDIDPAVESRIGELRRWFEQKQAWCHFRKLKGRRNRFRWVTDENKSERLLAREHRREIARALAEFPELDPAAPLGRARVRPRPVFPADHVPIKRGHSFHTFPYLLN